MNGPNVKPVVAAVVVAVLAEGILKANPVGAVVVPPCVATPKLNPPTRQKNEYGLPLVCYLRTFIYCYNFCGKKHA